MTGRQRIAGYLALWTASVLLTAAAVHTWGPRADQSAGDSPRTAGEATTGSGRTIVVNSMAADSSGPPKVYGEEDWLEDPRIPQFALQAPLELAHRDPPPEVRTCRQYLAWAQRQGAIPMGPYPVHALAVAAGRHVSVEVRDIAVVRAATKPQWSGGQPVELTCDSGGPAITAPPGGAASSSVGQLPDDTWPGLAWVEVQAPGYDLPADGYLNHVGIGGTEYELAAGQSIALEFAIDSPHGSDLFEYDIKVRLIVDGVPETHTVTNGPRHYVCCGRVTFMGYHAATYTWTMSPQRTVRVCPSQTYTGDAPPRKCEPPQPR